MKKNIRTSIILLFIIAAGGFTSANAVLAQNAPSILELEVLIAQLQEQIASLQNQIANLRGELAVVKTELQFARALEKGAQGEDVEQLQEFLAQFFDVYPEGLVTGYFGPLTEKAVRKFQAKYGIVQSGDSRTTGYGRVGPRTREKLNELVKEEKSPKPEKVKKIKKKSQSLPEADSAGALDEVEIEDLDDVVTNEDAETYEVLSTPTPSPIPVQSPILTPTPTPLPIIVPDIEVIDIGDIDTSVTLGNDAAVPAPTPVPSKTLSVSLGAYRHPEKVGGNYGYYAYDLIATIAGSASGKFEYIFYCDRVDSGTDITSSFAARSTVNEGSEKILVNACSYIKPGNYTAKVIIEREGVWAQDQAFITVPDPVQHSGTSFSSPIPYVYLEYSNVQVASISSTSATISWETNLLASSSVDYKAGDVAVIGDFNSTYVFESGPTKSHAIKLSNLSPNTLYSYYIRSYVNDPSVQYYIWDVVDWTTFTTASSSPTPTPTPNGSSVAQPVSQLASTLSALQALLSELENKLR